MNKTPKTKIDPLLLNESNVQFDDYSLSSVVDFIFNNGKEMTVSVKLTPEQFLQLYNEARGYIVLLCDKNDYCYIAKQQVASYRVHPSYYHKAL